MFKSLVVGDVTRLFGKVVRIKDWSDGSRTVVFESGKILSRKDNLNCNKIPGLK